MDFSHRSKLTALQRDLLVAFFERQEGFFLTGGAALSGFYLGHRTTEDLDLFAPPGASLDDAARALSTAAISLGGTTEPVKTFPEFRRLLARRGEESCMVDLVVDRAPMLDVDKPTRAVGDSEKGDQQSDRQSPAFNFAGPRSWRSYLPAP
ncbi:MAG: nucleotidyl transferase AbiEii/AbiGii toxin family protein [Myxococcales bacterium]|nr:nucleotidyl transferase AbiEii/AbiGii toxin family protein [Myxococcales bacterium]